MTPESQKPDDRASAPGGARSAGELASEGWISPAEQTRREHRLEGWALAAGLVILAVVLVIVFKQGHDNALARAKANRVETQFARHRLAVPVDHQTLIKVLGDNGGPLCSNPGRALSTALKDQQFYNGAAGPGARPVRGDVLIVEGQELAMQVYCPGKLAAFKHYVNGNAYYGVVKG